MKPKTNRATDSLDYRDNCQTPTYAWKALEPFVPKGVSTVLEPACGEGYLARDIHNSGYDVMASDKYYYEISKYFLIHQEIDFLSFYDIFTLGFLDITKLAIITNPPYSGNLKQKFLEKCFQLELPFALLMPHEFGSTSAYYKITKKYDICSELRFSTRVNFKMPTFGWSGSENKNKMAEHWKEVRIENGETDKDKLVSVPTAQFPVTWYTWGFTNPAISYVEIEKTETSEESI